MLLSRSRVATSCDSVKVGSSVARTAPARTESPTPTLIERITAVSSGCTTINGSIVISLPRAVTTRSTREKVAHRAALISSAATM
jgi:hypothetical protein